MDFTDQQKLYALPEYYLLLIVGDNDIVGLIDEETRDKIDECELESLGYYLEKVNFSELYLIAKEILEEEEFI